MALASFIITFREVLEAALIIGIILAYLSKTHKIQHKKSVYYGITAGIFASICFALALIAMSVEFEGLFEQLFEGTAMIVAALLLTTVIFWMMKHGREMTRRIHEKIDKEIGHKHHLGLFSLAFVAVLKEGIETVLFLSAATFAGEGYNTGGAVAGMIAALAIGYAIFILGKRINLSLFFKITGIMLILFAAGLFSHATHEFEEAGLINPVIEHLWDISHMIDENGTFGSMLKALFGYNDNPSLMEMIVYVSYILAIMLAYMKANHFLNMRNFTKNSAARKT